MKLPNHDPQQAHNDYLELLASGGIVAGNRCLVRGVVVSAVQTNLRANEPFKRAACFAALMA